MEYPMLMFIGKPALTESLYRVIAHEAAHQWFPMMVGSDEAAYAWLDEGLAKFLENRAAGEYFDLADPFGADRNAYLGVAGTEVEVPMMRHTDLISPFGARVVAAYAKPAVLLRSLEGLIGPAIFQQALNDFASSWLLRQATPWDFFRTFERHAQRDLDWFFAPWWFETAVLDHAITAVEDAATGRARVTIEDRGEALAPALVVGTTAAGETVSDMVPVEAWLDGARAATITLEATGRIVRVVLDPDQIFPDVDRRQAVWVATEQAAPAALP
jgi:aminopeptidase N